MNTLKKVDIATLNIGDELEICFPNGIGPKGCSFDWTGQKVKIIGFREKPKQVTVEWKFGGIEHSYYFDAEHLSYPTAPQQPVLIELEKAKDFLNANGYHNTCIYFNQHFSRPKNQYKPQAEYVTHNVKDLTAAILKRDELMDKMKVEQKAPFQLEDAKKLYNEGPTGKWLALQWYTNEELEQQELPMSWEELGKVHGWYLSGSGVDEANLVSTNNEANKCNFPTRQDAEAALAMSQLLQLRQAWLDIESPGWVPDWTGGIKFVIKRYYGTFHVRNTDGWYSPLSFPTESLATLFLATFHDLLNTAFCLPVKGGTE